MNPAFCVQCGEPVTSETGKHPFICVNNHESWVNPKPVVVCVQPVVPKLGTMGLAVARRAIEPKLGLWGLIGGNMDDGETVEEAALREWREETSVPTGALIGLNKSHANGRGHVLIEVRFRPITHVTWDKAVLCPENSEFGIWQGPDDKKELGFPIHQWIAAEWWKRRH